MSQRRSINFEKTNTTDANPITNIDESHPILQKYLYNLISRNEADIYCNFKESGGWTQNIRSGDINLNPEKTDFIWLSVKIETQNSFIKTVNFLEGLEIFINKSQAQKPPQDINLGDFNFAIGWDLTQNIKLNDDQILERAHEIAMYVSTIKSTLSISPLKYVLNNLFLHKLAPGDFELEQSSYKYIWVIQSDDYVNVFQRILNYDNINKEILKLIIHEFEEINLHIKNCPKTNIQYSIPNEIKKYDRFDDNNNKNFICYICFKFTKNNIFNQINSNNMAKQIMSFDKYLEYHISCNHGLLKTIIYEKTKEKIGNNQLDKIDCDL